MLRLYVLTILTLAGTFSAGWARTYGGEENDMGYDTTEVDTIPIQFLSNNGFEWENGHDNPWIESNDSIGSNNVVSNHYRGAEFTPPYQDSFMGYLWPEGLTTWDTSIVALEQFLDEEIKFEDVDSFLFYMVWAPTDPLNNLYRSCFIIVGEQDTLVFNYFEPRYGDWGEHNHVINVHDTPPATIWTEQMFTNIAEKAEEFNISGQTIQSVLIQNLGRQHPSRTYKQHLGVDEIYLWGHRIEITGIDEEHPTPVTHHWEVVNSIGSQIVLCYANRPEGFSASIYDASGRKVDEIYSASTSERVTWPVTHQSPGVYFIKPVADNSQTIKVIISR